MGTRSLVKFFDVDIDLVKPGSVRSFEVVNGDTGNVLRINVFNNGTAENVSNYKVLAVFSNTAGTAVQDSSDVDGGIALSGNRVTVNISRGSLAPGLIECELQLYTDAGADNVYSNLITSARFSFYCRESLLCEDALESFNEFPMLMELISDIRMEERLRAGNERSRISAETERNTAEMERNSAEKLRANAESGRIASEKVRNSAEAARMSSENSRNTSELCRVQSENVRSTAEAERVNNERSRVSGETGRRTSENAREEAEELRLMSETNRETCESARQTAERARIEAENERSATFRGILATGSQTTVPSNSLNTATTSGWYAYDGGILLVKGTSSECKQLMLQPNGSIRYRVGSYSGNTLTWDEWTSFDSVSESAIVSAVNAYLTAHPELAAGIPDGSITPQKTSFISVAAGSSVEVAKFTNQIPLSQNAEGGQYSDTGYKQGYRLNSSGIETAAGAYFCSGFIPAVLNDTVRSKNIALVTTNSSTALEFWSSEHVLLQHINGSHLTSMGAYTADGDLELELTPGKLASYASIRNGGFAYIRFTSVGWSGNSIITISEPIEYETVTSPGSMTLSESITVPKADSLDARVTALENASGIDTVPAYVRTAADELSGKILSHQDGRSLSIAFVSDLHCGYYTDPNNTSAAHAAQALKLLAETCSIDLLCLGGDLANGAPSSTKANTLSEIAAVNRLFSGICLPRLTLKGNHDDAPYRSTADRISPSVLFPHLGRGNLTAVNAVIDETNPNGNYGYIDFEREKLRIIYLNTDDKVSFPSVENDTGYLNAHNISAVQLSFLANEALDLTSKPIPGEWGIVVLSHVPLNISGTKTIGGVTVTHSTAKAGVLLCAYADKSDYAIPVGSDWVTGSYASKATGKIICCIHGHNHAMTNETLSTQSGTNSILSIGCPNAMNGREHVSADGITYTKTAGSANDTAFCVITVDRTNETVFADCYGAGYDRSFDY